MIDLGRDLFPLALLEKNAGSVRVQLKFLVRKIRILYVCHRFLYCGITLGLSVGMWGSVFVPWVGSSATLHRG